ncbi:MAG: ribosome-binding factor A [Myxococcota bacterium]|nr:ribosome-binding factor A [Myxococcota bacterium]
MAFGNRRADRVDAGLAKTAAEVLSRGDLPVDLPTFITVNSCKMSDDLRNCTLYISAFTDDPEVLEATEAALAELTMPLRQRLSRMVPMKYSPRLRLELDDSAARGVRVSRDLQRLVEEADRRESND